MNVRRFDDKLGGQAYPFLPNEWQWQIVSRPLDSFCDKTPVPSLTDTEPTLRWVKDDKVLDLYVGILGMHGLELAEFLKRTCLKLSLNKGAFVLSKRLSRIMRPYRYWGFSGASEITITYNEGLNPLLWDGCGQVSRAFVQRLADSQELSARQRRELLHANRFEVTTLHAGGQDKGHVLVVDELAVDFMFPAGSAKTELSLNDGRVFVGLQPIHSRDEMCLDIQSLINLYPFFQPEQLLAWAELESAMFLDGIPSGRLAQLLNRLYDTESIADLEALSDWHVGEYIASGGNLMWFAGMVKAVAKQHLKRLGSRASKMRWPIPGGRYYLFPAAVGGREVPAGHVELDPSCATAWVNDADWLDTVVAVLGGCDGDDAVWVLPFRDASDENARKVLLWRSPNQLGEYVVLKPTVESHTLAWDIPGGQLTNPKMQSRLLPTRIDRLSYQYGELSEASDLTTVEASYAIEAMGSTVFRAAANRGVLGAHCNVLMMCKALYGRLPIQLPATLEAVIDGTVKTGLDLQPVKRWNQMAMQRMVQHGQVNPRFALPDLLLARLPEWLQNQARTSASCQQTPHWLDKLARLQEQHKAEYWANVEALATEACPPLALFEQGRDWFPIGQELKQLYGDVIRRAFTSDEGDVADRPVLAEDDVDPWPDILNTARAASEVYLDQWPADKQPFVLLGAATSLYVHGPQAGKPVRDGVLWQLRESGSDEATGRLHAYAVSSLGRTASAGTCSPGIAQRMIVALREVGLLGEPAWTSEGPVLYYGDEPNARPVGVPVRINGIWLNWLNSRNGPRYARMGDVPAAQRQKAKARIADLAQTQFCGMTLLASVTDDNRVITRTASGNLFGFVQPEHELAVIRYPEWCIIWAQAVDGNVLVVLEPAG